MIRTGGKTFDPSDRFCYFIASNPDRQQWGARMHSHILVAVNELRGDKNLAYLDTWVDAGCSLLLDSGIFNLTMEHSRAHNVSMDVALTLAPDEIDGFDDLMASYLNIIDRYGDRAWGYIELDQGGRENKIKTRAKLEALGLRPIPVYHPLVDGWDYFDYLAERYDRICFGNIVQASPDMRRKLIATAWERHRKYPDLWIHLLGLTANTWLNAFPINSCDSSSWLSVVRWNGYKENADNQTFGPLDKNFQYVLGGDPTGDRGSQKAVMMSAYGVRMQQLNWRHHLNTWERLGCEIYPAPTPPTNPPSPSMPS